jgi:hypothetical protein
LMNGNKSEVARLGMARQGQARQGTAGRGEARFTFSE